MNRLPAFYVGDTVGWILTGFDTEVKTAQRTIGRGPFLVADIRAKPAAETARFHHQAVGVPTPGGIRFISGHLLEVL